MKNIILFNLYKNTLSFLIAIFFCIAVKAQTNPNDLPTSTSIAPSPDTDTASPTSNANGNIASPTTNLSQTENTDTTSPTSNVNTESNIDPTSEEVPADSNNTDVTEELANSVDPLEDIMESLHLQSYQYDPLGKRDPFFSLRIETEKVIKETEIKGNMVLEPLLPLERFPINQLKLMGIIWGTDQPRVLFIDPNNKSHVAKKNDRIGRKRGYLAEIREGEVIIAEPEQRGSKVHYSIKTLTLPKNTK